MVVENKVLMKVVFPNPDSPATYHAIRLLVMSYNADKMLHTIMVKAAPRFATILCLHPNEHM